MLYEFSITDTVLLSDLQSGTHAGNLRDGATHTTHTPHTHNMHTQNICAFRCASAPERPSAARGRARAVPTHRAERARPRARRGAARVPRATRTHKSHNHKNKRDSRKTTTTLTAHAQNYLTPWSLVLNSQLSTHAISDTSALKPEGLLVSPNIRLFRVRSGERACRRQALGDAV